MTKVVHRHNGIDWVSQCPFCALELKDQIIKNQIEIQRLQAETISFLKKQTEALENYIEERR